MSNVIPFRRPLRPLAKRIESPTNRHTVELAAVQDSVRMTIHAVDGTMVELWLAADESLEIGKLFVDVAMDAGAVDV